MVVLEDGRWPRLVPDAFKTPPIHLPPPSKHLPNTSHYPPPPSHTHIERPEWLQSLKQAQNGPIPSQAHRGCWRPRCCRRVLRKLDSFSGNTRVPGLPCCRSGPTTRAHHAQAPWLEPRLTFSVCIVTASQSTPTAATKPGANGAGQTPAFTWWSSHGASGGHGFSRYEARDT